MKETNSYLMFDGNCAEAMKFYAKCLDAKLDIMPFSQAPCNGADQATKDKMAAAKDLVMHARLAKGSAVIMASDGMPGMPLNKGNNFSINLACESVDETEKLFNAFGEKGTVTMPLQETFWAARFGMLTDQFGVNWMFNYEKPHQQQ